MPTALVNVFDDICSFETLYRAYDNARAKKNYRLEVMAFTANLEPNLFAIQRELLSGEYQISGYRVFFIYDPKLRMVMAVMFRDRIVQWSVYDALYDFYDKTFIEDSYACRRNKGTHRAADRLQYWLRQVDRKPEPWYYLKLDISKYFYRISHEILLRILSRRVHDERLLDLLAKIISSNGMHFGIPRGLDPGMCTEDMRLEDTGIPIGNLTSQLFANIYLNELDQYCKHVLHCHHYVRYMDDVIILSNDKSHLHELKDKIERFLNTELQLDLNKKTAIRPISCGVDFVGYKMWPTYRKLKKSSARRILRKVKALCIDYALGEATFEDVRRRMASYNGILQNANSYGLRQKIDALFIEYTGGPAPWPKKKNKEEKRRQ